LFGFQPFLFLSNAFVSATTGATLHLDLDFPAAAGLQHYRVLISAAGTGPTNYGIAIPLALDTMVWNSYFGNYPFPVSNNLHGALDGHRESIRTAARLQLDCVGCHDYTLSGTGAACVSSGKKFLI